MADSDTASIRHVNPTELETPPGYSQIVDVRANRLIFIAGQAAVDRNGQVVGKGDFTAQAEQVFRNLSAALAAVGGNAANLVKLTVFLRNMSDLAAFRDVRKRFLSSVTPAAAPAITLVEVSRLYGADFMIEIEAVAAI